ncbi:MAG: molybdopterin-dependent oxidoreductase, partial [Silicimonas sp.]|nr:molybdopterin-dependent oxidoreductase [Silicimonas sp.]
ISNFQHNLGEALGVLGKALSLQVTGGSTSMKDGFERMRQAGASARETLKRAAADRLGVDPAQLQTASGHVITPNGDKIAYTDLAMDAAGLEPVEVPLRDPSEWRYLGQTQPRLDMVGKATGTAEFGVDVRLPGMKFAAVRMNPKLGGAMNGYDDSAAKDMPGVEQIVDLGTGVAVIANNTWLANQAVEAIDVDWGDAPYPPETDGIFAKIAEAFDDSPNSTMRDDGDVSVTPEGATEITAEYRLPYLAHATMEPMNATALYTGDALELWCGNQAPTLIQFRVANTAGLDTDAVQIHT